MKYTHLIKRFCKICGKEINVKRSICIECEEKLNKDLEWVHEKWDKPKNKQWRKLKWLEYGGL